MQTAGGGNITGRPARWGRGGGRVGGGMMVLKALGADYENKQIKRRARRYADSVNKENAELSVSSSFH